MYGETILKIEGLNKSFGITHANADINLELHRGEVRALAGENGSGKSTLLSQIAGIYGSDSGTMYLNGQVYAPKSPMDANDNKIAIVVQELGLIADLPAGINVYLGRTKKFSNHGFINHKKIFAAANAELEKWGLPKINFNRSTDGLNIENRKMIELTRALSSDPDILILDEVTQSLSHDNREVIYELIKKFKELGRAILLISHDLEETLRISDSITVLRDGRAVGTVETSDVTDDDVKRMMVGREMSGDYYRVDEEEIYEDEVVFSFDHVSTNTGLKDVSFEVHKGEILAFCGLSDSGIHDVGQAAYGLVKPTSGKVLLNAENLEIEDAMFSLKHRIAYVPKDRDEEALMMATTIQNNFCVPSLEEISKKFGYVSTKEMREMADKAKKEYQVKCTSVNQNMNGLSGGNKQKVNLGRWLLKDLQLLIVDCPTRGVDIGVKAYIYHVMEEAKKKGLTMLLITDELTEAMGMADNIIVMKDGMVKKEIGRSSHFSEEKMIEEMI